MMDADSDRRLKADKPEFGEARMLVHVPIIHSQADMGSYREQVRHAYIRQKGVRAWEDSRRAIDRFWEVMEKRILSLDLDYARLRIYQDALPVCGREADIIRDLAQTGAANYTILQILMERGATVEGTESLELLLRERDLLSANGNSPGAPANRRDRQAVAEAAADLLRARDRFISARIDETLKPRDIGMLFIGALHHVTDLLPGTIKVMSLEDFETRLS